MCSENLCVRHVLKHANNSSIPGFQTGFLDATHTFSRHQLDFLAHNKPQVFEHASLEAEINAFKDWSWQLNQVSSGWTAGLGPLAQRQIYILSCAGRLQVLSSR